MFALQDPALRLALLGHVTSGMGATRAQKIEESGVLAAQRRALRQLSAAELCELAAMRGVTIDVVLDSESLTRGLRALRAAQTQRAIETYFIQHGASTRLIRQLFKIRRSVTLARRRELAAARPMGRVALPNHATRDKIHQVWHALGASAPLARYYALHQAFPHCAIAALETVIREFEQGP